MIKVFIDGSSGTTGLKIRERLSQDPEILLIGINPDKTHDIPTRCAKIAEADCAFLCLPDAAAEEIAEAIGETDTVVIDTSTAHRTASGWVYGMPELAGQRERITEAKRIANPGCHATGLILLLAPLVRAGMLDPAAAVSCTSLTGYTGGGKKMIAQYEGEGRDPLLDAPRLYGLTALHKHLPEMKTYAGLEREPGFAPVVADFPCGMETIVMLDSAQLRAGAQEIGALYAKTYQGPVVRFRKETAKDGFLSAAAMSGRDDLLISVYGNDDRVMLTAIFDNLGKGASGAAIQNMNLALHRDETKGLHLGGQE